MNEMEVFELQTNCPAEVAGNTAANVAAPLLKKAVLSYEGYALAIGLVAKYAGMEIAGSGLPCGQFVAVSQKVEDIVQKWVGRIVPHFYGHEWVNEAHRREKMAQVVAVFSTH